MRLILFVLMCCCFFPVLALKPVREYRVLPSRFGMNYKEEKIRQKDGTILNAWFFELPRKTTQWIVVSHSGEGNMADNLELVNAFLSAGYNVCTYDYRGYGASSDFEIDTTLFIYPQFINDLNAVLDYLRKSRAITRFDLYGAGIGAGLSIGVGAQRSETRKIIADGPWIELEFMKKRFREKLNKEIALPFGYDKNYEPLYAFEKPKAQLKGLMVIVSSNDPLIGPNDIRALKNVTHLFVVKNSPSNAENFLSAKNEYFERVKKFLVQ